MKTYLTLDKQLRSETDAEFILTLERKGWVTAPQPTYDPATQQCEWVDGAWVVSPVPPVFYTAEEHLTQSGYTPLRLLTCLDLESKLRAANAASAPLATVRSWLDALTLAAATNPDARITDWPAAPHSFDAVLADALTQLQSK